MVTAAQVTPILMEALRDIVSSIDGADADAATPDTPLIGDPSPMDSMHLVQFILECEERLTADLEIEVSLTDERAFSRSSSPFRSVRALTDYVLEASQTSDG